MCAGGTKIYQKSLFGMSISYLRTCTTGMWSQRHSRSNEISSRPDFAIFKQFQRCLEYMDHPSDETAADHEEAEASEEVEESVT